MTESGATPGHVARFRVDLVERGCERLPVQEPRASSLTCNQGRLCEQVEEAFIDADARDYQGVWSDCFETVERGHGRCETRRYWTLGELDGIDRKDRWKKLILGSLNTSEA